MTDPKGLPRFTDREAPRPTATDAFDDSEIPPLTVRLSGLWSDYVRGVNAGRNPDAPRESSSSIPLLDDMKGILQWE
ncbi:MAG TPA: hypothetical protein VM166_00480 [Gemmatimonadaceae bacterium]|nr:hypothetical protein [Gemmatimonadaceae bacterium]